MPGIRYLDDKEFIKTFQVIDRVIQNNQPIFIFVWVGSALVLIATLVIGIIQLEGVNLFLIILTTLLYIFGVQLPTIFFNIPLNNNLQILEVGEEGKAELQKARRDFEPSWNRWNLFRTIMSCLVSILLIILLSMM
jgi:uncharacterized membrane protein